MKIGDWKASAELSKVYADARALGLETNISRAGGLSASPSSSRRR